MGDAVDAVNEEHCDHGLLDSSSSCFPDNISCTTFNILAPIYKRMGGGTRESQFRERWLTRNRNILERLLQLKSSIICLQEFWVGSEELVGMYEKGLGDAGYLTHKLGRTNNRGDGLLTAVHQSQFRVLNCRELMFNDIGDRVAQILHVELYSYRPQSSPTNIIKEFLIVNTHLIFPHDFRYSFLRLQQVYKILYDIKSYIHRNALPPIPVILCGDWNGSKKGHVCKFLQSQGFISSYDIAHHYAEETDSCQKWVSHRNHRGNICGVDFIWLLNPSKHLKPLKDSFLEALVGNMKKVMSKEWEIPEILKTNASSITLPQFSQALVELGICGNPYGGLSDEDIKKLWDLVDGDGDGIADVTQFLKAYTLCNSCQHDEDHEEKEEQLEVASKTHTPALMLGFTVQKAVLFPPEVESGIWPQDYSLSDHAHLTVDFTPVEMLCA